MLTERQIEEVNAAKRAIADARRKVDDLVDLADAEGWILRRRILRRLRVDLKTVEAELAGLFS